MTFHLRFGLTAAAFLVGLSGLALAAQAGPADVPEPGGGSVLAPAGVEGEAALRRAGAGPSMVTTVYFTALDGDTQVNSRFLGRVQSVAFIAVDDTEVAPDEQPPAVQEADGSYTVSVPGGRRIGGVVLHGSEGSVRLLQDGRFGAPDGFVGIRPRDGAIAVGNGTVNETFNVSERADARPDIGPVAGAALTIGDAAAEVVAARPGQVAVVAAHVPPPSGSLGVTLTTASGRIFAGECPAWGYAVSVPPVVAVGAWAPTMLQATGCGVEDALQVTFAQAPGQLVRPRTRFVTAAAAALPFPVGDVLVERVGAQALSGVVARHAADGTTDAHRFALPLPTVQEPREGPVEPSLEELMDGVGRVAQPEFRLIPSGGAGYPGMDALHDYLDYLNRTWSGDVHDINHYQAIAFALERRVWRDWYVGLGYQSIEATTDGTLLVFGTPERYTLELTADGGEVYARRVLPRVVGPLNLEGLVGAGLYSSHYTETENTFELSGHDRGFGVRAAAGASVDITEHLKLFAEGGYLWLEFDDYHKGSRDVRFFLPARPKAEVDFSGWRLVAGAIVCF